MTIPLDYTLYRIALKYNKTSASAWGVIMCPTSIGTTYTYIQGVNNGTWVRAERSISASSDHAVMDGAREATPAGVMHWDIKIARNTTDTATMHAMWQTSTNASLTYNTGRSTFNAGVGTGTFQLQCEAGTNIQWVVEALDI